MKGFIFDLDGTLLDSLDMWRNIDIEYMAKYGITYKDEYGDRIKRLTFNECAYYFRDELGIDREIDDILQDWLDMSYHKYKYELELKPYAYEFVKECKKYGKCMVATSCDLKSAEEALKRNGLFEFMDCIITTNEIGVNKENPKIYYASAGKLGMNIEDCYVFEDVLSAMKTANDAGFKVIGVYDKKWEHEKEEMKRICVKYIESFKELL